MIRPSPPRRRYNPPDHHHHHHHRHSFTAAVIGVLLVIVFLSLDPSLDDSGAFVMTSVVVVVEGFAFPNIRRQRRTTGTSTIRGDHEHHHNPCHYSHSANRILRRPLLVLQTYSRKPNDATSDTDNNMEEASLDPAAPRERNVWDLLVNPYASSVIPPDLASEIYQAEGNTVAAQERTQRITLYAGFAVLGVTTAFFNGFLTELRNNPPPTTPDGTALADFLSSNPNDKLVLLDAFGFAWVHSNVVLTFCFTNQIGGGLALLLGGAAALLAEAEYDTRRTNAEKIYSELVQRRQQRQQNASTKNRDRTAAPNRPKPPSKRRVNSKEAKRLNALSEVVAVAEDTPLPADTTTTSTEPSPAVVVVDSTENTSVINPNPNLLDRVKDLYQQADTMAMTQALLLNQQLEEQGILPKITDETGLKVIPPAARRRTNTTNQETTGNTTTHDT